MDKRFDFMGVHLSVINTSKVFNLIAHRKISIPGYVCFPDTSVVKEANEDPFLASILNKAQLTIPDGKPSQLAAFLKGYDEVETVSGFHLCNALLNTGLSHYFYGGNDTIIRNMQLNIESEFPQANVLGYKAPPFLNKKDVENNASIQKDMDHIRTLNPDLVWIGISSPKQDYLMHFFYQQLPGSLMLGVGGVFLYFSDKSLKSPELVKKIGLRWAYRLLKEPARLWPKYYGTLKFLFFNSGYFIRALIDRKQ